MNAEPPAGWLDATSPEGHLWVVNTLLKMLFCMGLMMMPCGLMAQGVAPDQGGVVAEEVPAAVVASAADAVGALGQAVVQGYYQVALDRMNPKWKERYAKRMGGMEALEEKLKLVPVEMMKHGITMLSMKPQGMPRAFGVSPGVRRIKQNGGEVERLVYTQWLVLVPTMTKFRLMHKPADGGKAQWVNIESIGFQVAISDRDKLDWTFIDGAGLTVNDLRSLFVTLPQDLELPPLEKRETH